jgi:5-methyltetrahydropteroyltriglutamate--homocysteine methyltransferase
LGEGGFADEIAAAPPEALLAGGHVRSPLEDWPPPYGRTTGPRGSGTVAAFSFQSFDHGVSGRGCETPSTRIAAAMKNEHYDSEEAYLTAVATAIQVEYEAIVKSGFLLQLDCPDLALERHLTYNDRPVGEFLGFVERVIAAINKAIVNVPRDRVRLHVCWGNYEGPHDRDVPLADILPLLEQANVGGFVLPFANPRHQHEYRVLQQFPLADDQIIAAGVIDDLTGFVEHPEVVADRLENVARAVGDPKRVMACTDCGFDTSAGMGRVTEDVVWAKLAAMAEGARIATQRLF